jgi:hypothetical protein
MMLVEGGSVTGRNAFTKSFAPAVMVIMDLRWREVDPIY